MLNSNSPMTAGSECRQDPEDMLQRARERVETLDKGMTLVRELAELNINIPHNHEESLLVILGRIQADKWDSEKTIEYWLKEIDKG